MMDLFGSCRLSAMRSLGCRSPRRGVAVPTERDRLSVGIGRGHLDFRDALMRLLEPLAECRLNPLSVRSPPSGASVALPPNDR
jgi:hypothetical protein